MLRIMGRSAFACIGLAAGLLATGCSSEVQVPVNVIQPAEINMAGRKVVVVDPVSGEGGDLITSRLKQQMLQKGFTIVDRQSAISSINAENSLTGSNTTQVTHAAALIAGKVVRHSADANVETDTQTDAQTNIKNTVYRSVGTANLEVSFDITDLQTTALLASKSARASQTVTTDYHPFGPPPVNFGPMFDQCDVDAATAFVNMIAPHQVTLTAILYKVGNSPQNDAGIASFQGHDYAGAAAEFSAALSTARSQQNIDPKDLAHLHSNYGWAVESTFDYATATDQYAQAQRLSPDPAFAASIQRCRQRVVNDKRVIEQGGAQ